MKIQTLSDTESQLGESPIYIQESDEVVWTDITGLKWVKHNLGLGQSTSHVSRGMIGAIAVSKKFGYIAAVEEGFATLNEFEDYVVTNPILSKNERMNDGKCDVRGRFWAGSTHLEFKKGGGQLFRLDPSFESKLMLSDLTLPNGLDWSPNNDYFYLVDSLEHTIWRFEFELEEGSLSNKESFYRFNPKDGIPDGLCISAKGQLLVALYDGSAIQVISAEGALESIIHLPVKRPTSCTFIGRNLDNLVVTSASLVTETELHNGVGKTLLLTDLDFAGKKAYSFGISIMD